MTTTTINKLSWYQIHHARTGEVLGEIIIPAARYQRHREALTGPMPKGRVDELVGPLPEALEGVSWETRVYLVEAQG